MEFNSELVTQLIAGVLTILLPVLVRQALKAVQPVLQDASLWFRTHVSELRRQQVREIVRNFVLTCEQLGLIGELKLKGAEKKAWVYGKVVEFLTALGIPFVDQEILDLIEAIVHEEFTQFKIFDQELPALPDATKLPSAPTLSSPRAGG